MSKFDERHVSAGSWAGWTRRLLRRDQPATSWRRILLAGAGSFATIAVLALLADATSLPILAAAFGSSCVLVFTFPESPLSQPINVVAGHLISALCGLVVMVVFPVAWWSIALAVGLALSAMAALRLTHPPAGGNPIAIMLSGAGWGYLVAPILIGALVVACAGLLHRRLAPSGRVSRMTSGRASTVA